jgi:predicted Fe-Mo cluster-binding NifX family protein
MGKIAVMMTVARPEGKMSSHFGLAKWVMIADEGSGNPQFVRNEALSGSSVAELAIGHGCSDVIVLDIGDGALRRLQAAKIAAWAAPGPVSGREALEMFAGGDLRPVPPAPAERGEKRHGGCCCGAHAGPESSGCCGS